MGGNWSIRIGSTSKPNRQYKFRLSIPLIRVEFNMHHLWSSINDVTFSSEEGVKVFVTLPLISERSDVVLSGRVFVWTLCGR
jgi:hypothetical protein